MGALVDYYANKTAVPATNPVEDSMLGIPDHPSYLVGADNHQLGNTGSSILDPSTWGTTIDHGFKFSVSVLTRAVASTLNSGVAVGELLGIADKSNEISTSDWLQGMDDDLGKYYAKNKDSVNIWGDVAASLAPGLGGIKVLNWAQKGIAAATEGRAGLSLAAHFGTLPTKQALFAKAAAAEIAESTSAYSYINANLAKSLGTGYIQSALEMAAFNTAAAVTMKDSPLFSHEDASDIAYNSLLGGGMIGGGIMGTAIAARTIMDLKKAGNAVDAATHAWSTVLTEPAPATTPAERVAIHLNNIEAIPTIAKDDPLAKLKTKKGNDTRLAQLDEGREAMHTLTAGDTELGNKAFDVFSLASSEDVSNKLAGAVQVSRAGTDTSRLMKSLDINGDENYLKLTGGDAGTILNKPNTLKIADKFNTESAVLAKVSSYGHKQGQEWSPFNAAGDLDSAEARFIAATEGKFDPAVKIGAQDIPYLERAYTEMQVNAAVVPSITLKDGTVLDSNGLYRHLTDIKGQQANMLLDTSLALDSKNILSQDDIAKMVNISPSYLDGVVNQTKPVGDFFAMQADSAAYTKKMVDAGKYAADKPAIKTYLQPSMLKVTYDMNAASMITNHIINGMTAIKEEQAVLRATSDVTTDQYFSGAKVAFPARISGTVMTGANRSSVGGGLFSSQNSGYGALGSVMQYIGSATAEFMTGKANKLAETFAASGHKILSDTKAGTELWKTVQLLRQTPEQYELVAGRGLVNIKQMDYEAAVAAAKQTSAEDHLLKIKGGATSDEDAIAGGMAAGNKAAAKIALPVFEDTKAPVEIPFATEGMTKFATDWDNYHKSFTTDRANLRASQGLQTQDSIRRVFYIPPVDGRQFPHFAFVQDTSLGSTGHMSTIHANTAADLDQLAAKVPSNFNVMFKDQSERWHKAMQDYEYELGINENYIDSTLKRTGVSGSFFPRTDPKVLFDELMQWRKNQDVGLTRDMVEHRYAPEFAELRRQGAQYDLSTNSRTGYISDIFKAKQANPYTDYIKTALNVTRTGSTPIWSAVNRLAETGVDSAVSKLQDTFKTVKSVDDLAAINTQLKSIGASAYEDAATYALANHTAPKAYLSNWISQANSLLTFTMLRSDPMNALNNGFGHAVLYGTELPQMMRDVMASGNQSAMGALVESSRVTVPGTTSSILSPAKLTANAYKDFFANVVGKQDGGVMLERLKSYGTMPDFSHQIAMMESLTLKGTETTGELTELMKYALDKAKKMGLGLEKYSGNSLVEQLNRFVATHAADAVAQHAIAAGVITQDIVPSIVNTFVNRTQGVMLASQRPLMFQGPIGKAVGLFQTYQFNMLQQLFRYVGEGETKRVASLLGLQGSIYGLNGLPAFNAINQYLVGNAAGNTNHSDIVSSVYDATGKEAGNWLLYGASSNFLLHPDAKVNLYSRGDINPRQVTVIPTTLADVPIVGATAKFFGSMYEMSQKINKGGDVWGSFLQGVEHSGISRPLAGIAQTLEATNNPAHKAFSTTNSGDISMQNDVFSAVTAARLLGAKPLDEAVALDTAHRVQVYKASSQRKLENLGEAMKTALAGGGVPTREQINTFTYEYMKAGGKQQQFAAYYNRQLMGANKSQINKLLENGNDPMNRYAQKIMGGYELKDFNNSRTPVQSEPQDPEQQQ